MPSPGPTETPAGTQGGTSASATDDEFQPCDIDHARVVAKGSHTHKPRLGKQRSATFYESDPVVRSSGAATAEYVDAPVHSVSSSITSEQHTPAPGVANRTNLPVPSAAFPVYRGPPDRFLRIYLKDHRAGATAPGALAPPAAAAP